MADHSGISLHVAQRALDLPVEAGAIKSRPHEGEAVVAKARLARIGRLFLYRGFREWVGNNPGWVVLCIWKSTVGNPGKAR